MRRWSKLKKKVEGLMDPSLDFKIYCNAYEIGSYGNEIPRWWITIKGEIIWDFPKHYSQEDWYYEDLDFSQRLENYINFPSDDLNILINLNEDDFNLIHLLLSCDKRIGKRRLTKMREMESFQPFINIIDQRLINNH